MATAAHCSCLQSALELGTDDPDNPVYRVARKLDKVQQSLAYMDDPHRRERMAEGGWGCRATAVCAMW